mgnify:CR=1 FL=1
MSVGGVDKNIYYGIPYSLSPSKLGKICGQRRQEIAGAGALSRGDRLKLLISLVEECRSQKGSLSETFEVLRSTLPVAPGQIGTYNEDLLRAVVSVVVNSLNNLELQREAGALLEKETESIPAVEERGRILRETTVDCIDTCKRGRILRFATSKLLGRQLGEVLRYATEGLVPAIRGDILRFTLRGLNLDMDNIKLVLSTATEGIVNDCARSFILRRAVVDADNSNAYGQ